MRTIFLLFFSLSAGLFAGTITDLRLNDGTTLHEVEFISFSTSTVMAKWQGGRGTIAYKNLPPSTLEEIKPFIPAPSQAHTPAKRPPAPAPERKTASNREIKGQVFVTTMGAGGYKFAGAHVVVLSGDQADQAKLTITSNLPLSFRNLWGSARSAAFADAWKRTIAALTPVAETTTDADGRYAVTIPLAGNLYLFCSTFRIAEGPEYHVWLVQVGDSTTVDLNSSNQTPET